MFFFNKQPQRNSDEQCSLRRLQIDMQDQKLGELNDDTCEIAMKMDQNILKISMTPQIGFYRNRNYLFLLDFRIKYPILPPRIQTESDTLHPNIDRRDKKFYLRLLEQQNWKPIYGLTEIVKEMKQTLIHVDFTCIPNETTSLIMAQQILNQNQNNDEYELNNDQNYDTETNDFEISKIFKINFEIEDNEQQNQESQYDSNYIFYKEPNTINLQKTSNRRQNDNIFFIKIKN
ncbi:unnamed protein product [Paramecium pentaurelia]|uniref:UBC core domain-containing protein n=1 Tax=Paramecium pentaurelia TaxID=43138 RepID=A0A8S1SP07_9CILI|nr:unnamed protein product [Paramecium pentaurelia]